MELSDQPLIGKNKLGATHAMGHIMTSRVTFARLMDSTLTRLNQDQQTRESLMRWYGEIFDSNPDIWIQMFPASTVENLIGIDIPSIVHDFIIKNSAGSRKGNIFTDDPDALNQEPAVQLGWFKYSGWKEYSGKGVSTEPVDDFSTFGARVRRMITKSLAGSPPNISPSPQEYFTLQYGPTRMGKEILSRYQSIIK